MNLKKQQNNHNQHLYRFSKSNFRFSSMYEVCTCTKQFIKISNNGGQIKSSVLDTALCQTPPRTMTFCGFVLWIFHSLFFLPSCTTFLDSLSTTDDLNSQTILVCIQQKGKTSITVTIFQFCNMHTAFRLCWDEMQHELTKNIHGTHMTIGNNVLCCAKDFIFLNSLSHLPIQVFLLSC